VNHRALMAGLIVLVTAAQAQGQAQSKSQNSPLISCLTEELDRNFAALKQKSDPAPYFLSYAVTNTESFAASASLGALQSRNAMRRRSMDVTVRVGDYELDNYRQLRNERRQFASAVALLPIEDDFPAIRRIMWANTERTYRTAARRLLRIRTDQEVKAQDKTPSADFSREEPVVAAVPTPPLRYSAQEWAAKLRRWSAEFAKYPDVTNSSVMVIFERQEKQLVNTEGTRVEHGRTFARVVFTAQARAQDGMDLATTDSFEALSPDALPGDAEVAERVRAVAAQLTALLRAPVVEPFVGPAILSGRASGVFFHEIFGHRVEGHRQKDEAEGQTFTRRVGGPVLPEFLSVVFDPTMRRFGNQDLNGWYGFDDEGVAARKVVSVDKGVLREFLMSRSPIPGFEKSNGHGRRQLGYEVASRQSNLLVQSSNAVSDARLRELLIAELRLQNKPYGLFFQHVTGGYTTTQRQGLQAFTVIPLVVYRVYADGRPDELVRGADIVGTPLASFAKIAATSDRSEVFNGYCGAESGSVPVSAISPALLVTEIEIQKKSTSQERPPLLPRPSVSDGSGSL
jgi:TldD protein